MVFQLIWWVDLCRSLFSKDTEEHDAPPPPNRQVPPFAGNSSEGSRTPPTLRSAAGKRAYCKKGVLFCHNIPVFLTPMAKFGLCF